MAANAEFAKKFSDGWYGPNAAIGDGKFIEILMKLFQDLLGSCPLGARRAYNMMTGGPAQQRRAHNILEARAHQWFGDEELTAEVVKFGVKITKSSDADEFVEFVKIKL